MMRKVLFILLVAVCSCTGSKKESLDRVAADRYVDVISGFTCEKAIVTADSYLAIGVDAIPGTNYDALARQFLDEAKREGVTGLKGCYIVDVKDAKFGGDAVIGSRIGRAYN